MPNRFIGSLVLMAVVSGSAFASGASVSHKAHHRKAQVKKAGAWKKHGQHAIDPDRTREIQEALIREHYLTGQADGNWNADTKAAMAKYQKDNGWQSKRVPDSRALIKLGLGPSHEAMPATEVAGAGSPYSVGSSSQR